jgi:hypothetical protein
MYFKSLRSYTVGGKTREPELNENNTSCKTNVPVTTGGGRKGATETGTIRKRNFSAQECSKTSLIRINWERNPVKLVKVRSIEVLLKICSGKL